MDRAAGLGQCGRHTAVISTLKASVRRVTASSRGPVQRRPHQEAPLRREEGTGPSVPFTSQFTGSAEVSGVQPSTPHSQDLKGFVPSIAARRK